MPDDTLVRDERLPREPPPTGCAVNTTEIECAIARGLTDREIAHAQRLDVGEVLKIRLWLDQLVADDTDTQTQPDLTTSAGRWKAIFDDAYPDSPAVRFARRKALVER